MKPSKSTTTKITAGGNRAPELEKSKTILERISKQKEEFIARKRSGGMVVIFDLFEPSNTTGCYVKPKEVVFIPDDYAKHDYIKDIVELDENGEPLTGMQEIRYVRNLNSIFVANQPENVTIEPLVLLQTNTLNDKRQKNLVNYMRISNANAVNPIRDTNITPTYKEIILDIDMKKEHDNAAISFQAEQIVFENDIAKLYPLANIFGIDMGDPFVMKTSLRREAVKDPAAFIALFNNVDMPIIERLISAKALGIIDVIGRRAVWKKNSEVIAYIAPDSTDWTSDLVDFTKTSEGEIFLSELDAALEKAVY